MKVEKETLSPSQPSISEIVVKIQVEIEVEVNVKTTAHQFLNEIDAFFSMLNCLKLK